MLGHVDDTAASHWRTDRRYLPIGKTPLAPSSARVAGLHAALHHASIALPFLAQLVATARALCETAMSSKTSLDKSRIKFLLLEGIHPSALEVLRAAG